MRLTRAGISSHVEPSCVRARFAEKQFSDDLREAKVGGRMLGVVAGKGCESGCEVDKCAGECEEVAMDDMLSEGGKGEGKVE